jgi:hypothetical protein
LTRIQSKKNIVVGFIGVLLLSITLHLFFNQIKFIGGFLWGVTLSYAGLLLFLFLPNFNSDKGYNNLSMAKYLFRSTIRMGTLLILFVIIVFLLKVNALGLLAGAFIGMIGLSFTFLFKMKPSQ